MQPQKLKIAFLVCFMFFLLHQQRALLLHQAYHFPIVEEEFRIRRRNQRRSMLMFFSQMNQQNTQRRRRRAWLRPWHKTGSIVFGKSSTKFPLERTFSYPWKPCVKQASSSKMKCVSYKSFWYLIEKRIWLTSNFLKLFWWCVSAPVRVGWTRLGSVLRHLWTRYVTHA